MKLKTLKDFERIKGQFTTEDICKAKNYPKGIIIDALGCPHIDIRILRAEAIKWIKAFGVAEPFSKKLDAERQFIRKISIEGKSPHAVAQEVIKHLFNITDSELSKEG